MSKQSDSVGVEETYGVPILRVWDALTRLDQMKQWYFAELEAFEPRVGFETRFTVQVGDRSFRHHWKLTRVVPPNLIQYQWRYDGYPGDSFVTFELAAVTHGTRLRVTHEGAESFPQEVPEFSRESCTGGWTYFITATLDVIYHQDPQRAEVVCRASREDWERHPLGAEIPALSQVAVGGFTLQWHARKDQWTFAPDATGRSRIHLPCGGEKWRLD